MPPRRRPVAPRPHAAAPSARRSSRWCTFSSTATASWSRPRATWSTWCAARRGASARSTAAAPTGAGSPAALALPAAPEADSLRLPLEAEFSLTEKVDEIRRRIIQRVLERSGGKWSEAARRLRLDRGNLHRMAQRLGLLPRHGEDGAEG